WQKCPDFPERAGAVASGADRASPTRFGTANCACEHPGDTLMRPLLGGAMTAPDIISATRIGDVWGALGGGELRNGRGRAWWRGGDGFNISLSDTKGVWYDHVTGDGGGVLDLVQNVRGGTRREALRWLADYAGVPLDNRPLRGQELAEYAQRRRAA